MGEQDWTAFEAQPVRERGVYDVEVVVGDRVQSPPVVIRLHFLAGDFGDWTMPDGRPYDNPVGRFLRYRRVGDLPD
ncbi:MAG: hypothetical protein IH936_02890 [Acidobacteria bacterium]|nr:hypothetical protein [Acidobacteriota bacterium]